MNLGLARPTKGPWEKRMLEVADRLNRVEFMLAVVRANTLQTLEGDIDDNALNGVAFLLSDQIREVRAIRKELRPDAEEREEAA